MSDQIEQTEAQLVVIENKAFEQLANGRGQEAISEIDKIINDGGKYFEPSFLAKLQALLKVIQQRHQEATTKVTQQTNKSEPQRSASSSASGSVKSEEEKIAEVMKLQKAANESLAKSLEGAELRDENGKTLTPSQANKAALIRIAPQQHKQFIEETLPSIMAAYRGFADLGLNVKTSETRSENNQPILSVACELPRGYERKNPLDFSQSDLRQILRLMREQREEDRRQKENRIDDYAPNFFTQTIGGGSLKELEAAKKDFLREVLAMKQRPVSIDGGVRGLSVLGEAGQKYVEPTR
jgi:hypothetical protein